MNDNPAPSKPVPAKVAIRWLARVASGADDLVSVGAGCYVDIAIASWLISKLSPIEFGVQPVTRE